MHGEIMYIHRQPEKESLRRKLRANTYGMYTGQTPHRQSGIRCEIELINQEAAVVRH